MGRIEEFNREGKKFIYVDFSGLKSGEEFLSQINTIKPIISKYPEHSLHTITNIEDVRIDSITKNILLDYIKHNQLYVKSAVVIGIDGIKKMVIGSAIKSSGRNNTFFTFTKEKAIEWTLQQ